MPFVLAGAGAVRVASTDGDRVQRDQEGHRLHVPGRRGRQDTRSRTWCTCRLDARAHGRPQHEKRTASRSTGSSWRASASPSAAQRRRRRRPRHAGQGHRRRRHPRRQGQVPERGRPAREQRLPGQGHRRRRRRRPQGQVPRQGRARRARGLPRRGQGRRRHRRRRRTSAPKSAEDKDKFEDEDGCPDPDNDKDGVLDEKDKCPNEPETKNGYQDDDGCPDEVPVAVKKFTGVVKGINFRRNSADIKASSFPLLKEAVSVFKEYPALRVEISGHTSERGQARLQHEAVAQARRGGEGVPGVGGHRREPASAPSATVPTSRSPTTRPRKARRRTAASSSGCCRRERRSDPARARGHQPVAGSQPRRRARPSQRRRKSPSRTRGTSRLQSRRPARRPLPLTTIRSRQAPPNRPRPKEKPKGKGTGGAPPKEL